MDNSKILNTKINWVRVDDNIRYCFAYYQEKVILLRMNDFPDEPLFTLINGISITDLDELPSKWSYPYLSDI